MQNQDHLARGWYLMFAEWLVASCRYTQLSPQQYRFAISNAFISGASAGRAMLRLLSPTG